MIDGYLDEFERWIAGGSSRRRRLRAELEAHLSAAREDGDLEGALKRLGSPRMAARSFAGGLDLDPAPLRRRIPAFLIDVGITVVLLFATLALGTWAYGQGNDSAAFLPLKILVVLIVAPAIAWWPVGLTLAEWRYGRTPGKAMMGLEVMSEDGTAPGLGQVLVRRLTLVFSGPLQIIDWAYALFNDKRQRALDKLAGTMVVAHPEETSNAGALATPPAHAI